MKEILNRIRLSSTRFSPALMLVFVVAFTSSIDAQTRSGAGTLAEQKTARRFEGLRKSPPQMYAFLKTMPKGGDLHSHLSGAVYAESYIQWAAAKNLCVNQSLLAIAQPPCDQSAGKVPASTALTNPTLYRQLIDAWSMRNWENSGQSGHDHFFDTFAKFGGASFGEMLAEVSSRAANGHVSYLELMLTPDGSRSSALGFQVGWDGDFEGTLRKLKTAGIDDAISAGVKTLQDAEAEKNTLLKCGTPQADPGCNVTIRYVAQVSRASSLGPVFAQLVTGFALASDPNSKVVGVNLVQPEDSFNSMHNFRDQMEMLNFLRPKYPAAHITLHAGELAPGLVPPNGLSSHIRDSVVKGHAERIGHGVDILYEDQPYDLLKDLVRRDVMIEICLTSNDTILGVRKEHHPLATYLQHDVPVALATDDEGVARSEITMEYLKAVQDHGLGYLQLKKMARTSLQYAFLPGKSLWRNLRTQTAVAECAPDLRIGKVTSSACKQYLSTSEKARLQWDLEKEFKAFESK